MKMYFITVLPPPEIEERIKPFKMEIQEKYHAKNALKLPAHITLIIPFRIPEEEEKLLIGALTHVAQETYAFEVDLSGFGYFRPRVIFVKIEDHKPIVELHEKLISAIKELGSLKEEKINHNIHPHISIASRDLKKEDFPSAWKDFQGREFSAIFMANNFCLFKHNGKSWDLRDEFSLKHCQDP